MQRINAAYSKNRMKLKLQLLVKYDKKDDLYQEKDKKNGNLRGIVNKTKIFRKFRK